MTNLFLPAEARRDIIREYGKRYGLTVFVESGTATGDTPFALRDDFRRLHTIEIDHTLYEQARARLARYPQVFCWLGDSAEILPFILTHLHERALFWLDGHWSGSGTNPVGSDTPIRDELEAVLADPYWHVILVDDARVFREGADWETEKYDYPTLSWVRDLAESYRYEYELADDIIRLVPCPA